MANLAGENSVHEAQAICLELIVGLHKGQEAYQINRAIKELQLAEHLQRVRALKEM